jgi:hypothetical protein
VIKKDTDLPGRVILFDADNRMLVFRGGYINSVPIEDVYREKQEVTLYVYGDYVTDNIDDTTKLYALKLHIVDGWPLVLDVQPAEKMGLIFDNIRLGQKFTFQGKTVLVTNLRKGRVKIRDQQGKERWVYPTNLRSRRKK